MVRLILSVSPRLDLVPSVSTSHWDSLLINVEVCNKLKTKPLVEDNFSAY